MNQTIITIFCGLLIVSARGAWGLRCYDCFNIGEQFPDPPCIDPSQGSNKQQNVTHENITQVWTSQKKPGDILNYNNLGLIFRRNSSEI